MNTIYEVILSDGSRCKPFETRVGIFDSKEKAEDAVKHIKELVELNNEDHCVPYICICSFGGELNKLDTEVLEYWNLYEKSV